jgi:hypothetical protein
MNSHFVRLPVLGLALLLLAPTAFAKKKPTADFSPFKGHYSGSLLIAQGAIAVGGTTNITITVPKKGNTAVITYGALVNTGTSTLPLSTTLYLKTNDNAFTSDVVVGIGGTPFGGAGKYHVKKNKLTFSTTAVIGGVPYVLDGTATVKDSGKKRKLVLLMFIRANGTLFISLTNTVNGRAPKEAK